ncbi:FAD-binding domain [Fragilaria crotonensis]|nr:FAD-binding domain [Fragilaria crotonensis]
MPKLLDDSSISYSADVMNAISDDASQFALSATFPISDDDDAEQPSLGVTSDAKVGTTSSRQPRSSSMVEVRPRLIKHQQRRSASMDLDHGARRRKQRRNSDMISLDSEMGVLLNLTLGLPPRVQPFPPPQLSKSNQPNTNMKTDTDVSLGKDDHQDSVPPLTQISLADDTIRCHSILVNSHLSQLPRRGSARSCVSALSFPDEECPTSSSSNETTETGQVRRKTSLVTWKDDKTYPNHPHPALEYPPLYFFIRRFPHLLEASKGFFQSRWRMTYPLQQKLPFSRTILRKLNIFITFGELLLILPFIVALLTCTVYSFIHPSVSVSGHASRVPLIFAFVTAMRNSPLTMLLGIPFERAIWYHKLSARLAYVNGLMHTYVSFVHPDPEGAEALPPPTSLEGSDPDFGLFLFSDTVNSGGTMLLVFMTLMMVTALPFVRRRVFEVFYYLHVLFVVSMVVCAFFHTGVLVPTLVALTWGVDLVIRKVYMACIRYPRKASVRIISDTVVEVCFPKIDGFDYNPGQYINIAIPELSLFEWHPFSLSSSPEQKIVTLHIRRVGGWTSALYDLATKQMEVSILLEGPYGSVGVDLASDRYKMVMLFSGGIGVTPMQALCNQLMYEQSTGMRELKKLSFVWIERDPNVMQNVDVVRRKTWSAEWPSEPDIEEGNMDETQPQGIASTLLSLVPASFVTDEQLEDEYSSQDLDEDSGDEGYLDSSVFTLLPSLVCRRKVTTITERHDTMCSDDDDDDTMNQSVLDAAYNDTIDEFEVHDALDLQVYLTTKVASRSDLALLPFVYRKRPDVKELFRKMREEAISMDESRVAVCVCAPERLVHMCQKACAKYSDHEVQFDFHFEVFG